MNKKFFIIFFLILAGAFLGYLLFISSKNTPEVKVSTEKTSEVVKPETFSVVLESQNNSGESGIAVFEAVGDKTKVKINLVGFQPGVEQPAHFHGGTCEYPVLEKYDINNVMNGKSETIVDVKLKDLLNDLPLVLNIHKSIEEDTIYTSCAEIEPSSE